MILAFLYKNGDFEVLYVGNNSIYLRKKVSRARGDGGGAAAAAGNDGGEHDRTGRQDAAEVQSPRAHDQGGGHSH